ncbi:unnamed protein product [Mytilus coruscus]|uniref:Mab-21-like nucleotidyltransferase domain-containing protein n=1 Tax=Mytilus coruscus TaxID=42192 RepID=A0A6J8ADB7_MYTCO|nr:unnamed protein product [Mytilus coruscus]
MDNQKDIQSLSHNSCKVYHYLSDKFGSKTVVKCRRFKFKCFDDCMQNADIRIISSGSRAEGLDLPGSDLHVDLMFLSNEILVHENVPDDDKDAFLLDTENASVGFAFIKVPKGYSNCINVTNTFNGFLLTNKYFKERCIYELANVEYFMGISRRMLKLQGPSVSVTFQGIVDADLVQCYTCYDWPSVANKWIFRSRFSNWPSENMIKESLYEGVFLVPVGKEILSQDLIHLTYWWNLPTLDQIRYKKIILQSKSFLKRLRTSFSKSVQISKNNDNENGFMFHKDLTVTSEDFCMGSPIAYHRYLTFLYAYKEDSTRGNTIALQSLKEVVENSINSDVLSICTNYICLLKAQQHVAIQENYKTYQRMLSILSSSDTKHIFSTLNKMF